MEYGRHARYVSIPHNNNQRSKCRYFVLAQVKIPKQREKRTRARLIFLAHRFILALLVYQGRGAKATFIGIYVYACKM